MNDERIALLEKQVDDLQKLASTAIDHLETILEMTDPDTSQDESYSAALAFVDTARHRPRGARVSPKHPLLRTQRKESLLRAARRYARMKKFGVYVKDNVEILVSASDVPRYTQLYEEELKEGAEKLLLAMAIDEVEGELVE